MHRINSSVMVEGDVLTPQEDVMVTMTVLIALMSKAAHLILEGNLASAGLVNSDAIVARVSLNVLVVMGAGTVQMDPMRASVLTAAGLTKYDAKVVAV